MNVQSTSEENIDFPLFKQFLDEIKDDSDGSNINVDIPDQTVDFDLECQTIKHYIEEQISKKSPIFISHELLNPVSFSSRSHEIYIFVKDALINFSQSLFDEFISSTDPLKISENWKLVQNTVNNISDHFVCFVQNQESYENIVYSEFKNFFSTQDEFISLLHDGIVNAFNTQICSEYVKEFSDLLIHCTLLNFDKIIPKLTFEVGNIHQLHRFADILHLIIPKDCYYQFFDYILSKEINLSDFFQQISEDWSGIYSLYELYHYQRNDQEFAQCLGSLIRSQCTTYNPFQILDEINLLVTTDFMYVIRTLAGQLFNSQNETFSILLASYIHVTFKSLKEPILNHRLFLFDELSQLSNGYFIQHHSQNLLKRLLNFNELTFDADLRFAKMCNNHNLIAIIEDFKNHQKQIEAFPNPSSKLTFSIFYSKFFTENRITSSLQFPNELLPTVSAFEAFMGHAYAKKKLNWNFKLMQVTMDVSNVLYLKKLKCNGQYALLLIALSEQPTRSISKRQLIDEYHFNENEASDSIIVLSKFSLITYHPENEMIELENKSNAIDNKINIPLMPHFRNYTEDNSIDSIRIEVAIIRYVKIHPNLKTEDVYTQLQEIPGFSCSKDEYYNSLRNLIKKQIISPLDCHKILRLT